MRAHPGTSPVDEPVDGPVDGPVPAAGGPPADASPPVLVPGTAQPYLDVLAGLQDAFLAGVRAADPRTPVPWCGRWRVRDLVVHLARIHHWAAGQAARRREAPLGRGPFDLPELYGTCATELLTTLRTLAPDATASTLLGPGPVAFWHRRQVHETLVHLWDLRTATGSPTHADPAVWADTVDEVVTVMQPRQVALGRTPPLPVRVDLHAVDADRSWTFAAAGADDPGTAPRVEVRAPADALALLLWRRLPADAPALAVRGEASALEALLTSRLVP
ncbi:maleylpyruvate isomerase family mycothiol-dependent enzyme [Cellulomonas oligotrophica]|uniref:Uncharacterized protein (TIGR03083 family) n=1 Tax=Cellulomonas oligotrophica TaxID=931536 RepID=A0A7Y9FD56_9CELL|nr:maleylpyruvate isomerase family mycothiol-dependent enzyme [Cellulomonas oligotrophica]NYD85105.1 uncharacterized protein (TIGR03083 family) [Cellulomonas oligotrophica]GIG33809.1 hypothetical protein Col01nite_29680 [Cellulomonas oligotrophica]